jgi:hypothetical protein
MRLEEAAWIGLALSQIPAEQISPCLELGCSTLEFRTVQKPHIEAYIHAPLRGRGVGIVHSDIKAGEGIDICGDIFQTAVQDTLRNVNAKCVLCCNILEHVVDRKAFAAICDTLLMPQGYMVVTVPQSYPLHADPIDTYFRVTPEELAELFPGYSVVENATVESDTYLAELRQLPHPALALLKLLARIAFFRGGLEATKCRAHRLLWMFRRYKVAAVVLRKPAVPPA